MKPHNGIAEPTGRAGELVERLLRLLTFSPREMPLLPYAYAPLLSIDLGGSLGRVGVSISEEVATLGNEGVAAPGGTRVVSLDAFIQLARERLTELVEEGVAEDFIVRALRDHLDLVLQQLLGEAPLTEQTGRDAGRVEDLKLLAVVLPEAFGQVKKTSRERDIDMASYDPTRIGKAASRTLNDVDGSMAIAYLRWAERKEELLADTAIALWRMDSRGGR